MRAPSDRRSAAIGGLASWLVFCRLLLWNWSLRWPDALGGMFDSQARAFADGHLDIRDDSLGFEAFVIGSEKHSYFGVLPSLVRVPLNWLFPSMDGRWTRLSLLIGSAALFAVIGVLVVHGMSKISTSRLGGWPRALTAAGSRVLVATAGPWFLASRAWAYHEAMIWGLVFSLAAFALLLRSADDHNTRRVVARLGVAAVCVAAALHSRFTLGVGAAIALGLTVAWLGWSRRAEFRDRRLAVRFGGVAALLVIAAASYATVNWARFGSLIGVPVETQVIAQVDPQFAKAIAENDGTIFGLRYAPSTAWALLQPDGIDLRSSFPGVGLPTERFEAVGDVALASNERTASVTAMSPLMVILAVLGMAGAVSRARRRDPIHLLCLIGAAAGTLGVLLIGYVATRYVADLLPFLIVGMVAAMHSIGEGRRSEVLTSRVTRVVAAGLLVWSVIASLGVAVQYQRELGVGLDDGAMVGWLDLQHRLGPIDIELVERGVGGVTVADLGTVLVVGDCDALYRSNGDSWRLLLATPSGGRLAGTVTGVPSRGRRVVVARSNGTVPVEFLIAVDGGTTRFGVRAVGREYWSREFDEEDVVGQRLVVQVDPVTGFHALQLDGVTVASMLVEPADFGAPRFVAGVGNLVRPVEDDGSTETCGRITGRS